MLPYVKINFENGRLGSVAPSADCVVGLVCNAVGVDGKLTLEKPYILYRTEGLEDLGVTSAINDVNAHLYKVVKDFYAQAGDGAELWLLPVAGGKKQSEVLEVAKEFVKKANGRLRFLAIAVSQNDLTIENGLDKDVMVAAAAAQELGEWATNSLYAPLVVLLEAKGVSDDTIVDMPDLTEQGYNRVGILVGDTEQNSTGAAMGVLAGKLAACPIQRHIGRVRDGSLVMTTCYIGSKDATVADVETLNNKGYITFRTFVGKAGYFFADDHLATAVEDDYRSIARRRTIDKAYRIAYDTMLNYVNDEIPVTNEGTLVPSMCKAWESELEVAIMNNMTANGELGVDASDDSDTGVRCFIDYNQKVLSTSRIEIALSVKPYGYAKYIEVKLGFLTTNEN